MFFFWFDCTNGTKLCKKPQILIEILCNWITSVIRQKGESQNGYFKKTKHAKFCEKRTFLMCAYQEVRNVCLSY